MILMNGRTVSSVAMLIALVTTVTPLCSASAAGMARATSTVVVPPFSDTVQPGHSMSTARWAICAFASPWLIDL